MSNRKAAKFIKAADNRLDLLKDLVEDMIVYSEVTIDAAAENALVHGNNSLELAAYSLLDSAEVRTSRATSLLNLSFETAKQEALHLMGYSPNILDDIASSVSGFVDSLLTPVYDAIHWIYETVTSKIDDSISWVVNSLTGAFNSVTTWINDSFAAVTVTIEKGAKEIYEWTLGTIEGVSDFLEPFAQMLAMGFIHVIDTFKSLLTIEMEDLVNIQVSAAKAFEDRQLTEVKKRAGVS